MKVDKAITEDEAALYDRQIRLWGVDAQRRLLSSRILIINMKGLGAEIAKNLVLGGINSLTLLDSNEVESNDLKFNFLLPHKSVGQNRAESCLESLQTLNPMVKIVADTDKIEQKDESYFSRENFDIVCALIDDKNELERINSICRKNNVLFLCGHVFGLFGYLFVDFNDYTYIAEVPKIIEDSNDKKKAASAACCPSDQKQNNDKQTLEEKNLKYVSYKEFQDNIVKPLEGLSANKLKRLSKAYYLTLFLNKFHEANNRNFSPSSIEDIQKIVEIKNALFETYKMDTQFIADSEFNERNLTEFVPVNAILGGTIAQEIIKGISKKNEPIQNVFLFDGNIMSGEVLRV